MTISTTVLHQMTEHATELNKTHYKIMKYIITMNTSTLHNPNANMVKLNTYRIINQLTPKNVAPNAIIYDH